MSNKASILPSFASPPLTEVVISVQFSPIQNFELTHIGLLWKEFENEFPLTESHHPLDNVTERTGLPVNIGKIPKLEFINEAYFPRVWFLDEGKRELIQIQNNRFIRNWRKVDNSDDYPRYEKHIRPKFEENYKTFLDFIRIGGLVMPPVEQVEVTYVNTIDTNSIWSDHSEYDSIFRNIVASYKKQSVLQPEHIKLTIPHLIEHKGKFLGRLTLDISPAIRNSSNSPVYRVQLVARGTPLDPSLEGILGFADIGRESIVNTFDNITTVEMHKAWGKESK